MGLAIFGVIVSLLVGSLIGAAMLRAAISLANKMIGSQAGPATAQPWSDADAGASNEPQDFDPPSDVSNPYSAPALPATEARNDLAGVPQPNFGRAIGISVLTLVVSSVIGSSLNAIGLSDVLARTMHFVANAFVATLILKQMLPTTLRRAVLVYVIYGLILLAIGLLFAAVAFAIRALVT